MRRQEPIVNQYKGKRSFSVHGLTTLALVFAASASVAPIKFATRVEAAMDIGKGIWNVRAVIVLRTLCAAKCDTEKKLAASVRISKARNSASTIINPGIASLIIGPIIE